MFVGGSIVNTGLSSALALKAPLASPSFTGSVVSAGDISLNAGLSVASDSSFNSNLFVSGSIVNTGLSSALALKAPLASPSFTGSVVSAGDISLNASLSVASNSSFNGNLSVGGSIVNTGLTSALGLKAPLDSPALTGTPSAPTAVSGTNTTQIATTQYVRSEISALVASAPETLDTLNELATALGNDAAFSTTITNSIGLKAPSASPSFTGTFLVSSTDASFNGNLFVNGTINNTGLSSALALKAPLASPSFTGSVVSAGDVSLNSELSVGGNVVVRKDITVDGKAIFNSDVSMNGSIVINGNIVPSTANTFSLGSVEKPFKSLHVNINTIYFVDQGNVSSLSYNKTTGGIDIGNNGNTVSSVISKSGRVAIGKLDPEYDLDVNGNVNVSGKLFVGSDVSLGSQLVVQGNVGIGAGTANTAYKLDVSGSANFSGITRIVSLNTVPVIISGNTAGTLTFPFNNLYIFAHNAGATSGSGSSTVTFPVPDASMTTGLITFRKVGTGTNTTGNSIAISTVGSTSMLVSAIVPLASLNVCSAAATSAQFFIYNGKYYFV